MGSGEQGGPRVSARRRVGVVAVLTLVGGLLLAPTAQAATTSASAHQASTGQLATGSGVTAAGLSSAGPQVKAADLSQFQPGNIISDAKFFDRNTMTEAQIQQFLEAKMPRCAAGYTCLKDYYDTSRTTTADPMCAAYPGGMRERASTIIYKVAQACGINPQVILVMLQKEQGLVLRSAPTADHYRAAMGQACPDTGPCDVRYYGLFNQIYGGAWQLKRYGNPPGTSQYFTWYAPGRTWNIQWHPNAGCGSAPVHIQNQATANLYYYTPYQPNVAALRAGYGEGDSCSSYGNRNFFQFFTDWFGSTQTYNNPFGNVELVAAAPGEFRVVGWAADLDTTAPISIHVYVGAQGSAFVADLERGDVGAAYPVVGSRHGFDVRVPAVGAGPTNVCVYGINAGSGANVLLACLKVEAMSGPPVGKLDAVKVSDGGVEVSGWAIDPDSTGATSVHVYVGSVGTALSADRDRPELATTYPAYGAKHGFTAKLTAPPGANSVCAYAINIGAGGTTPLGCQTVTVPGSVDLGRAPFGNYEALVLSGNTATASGWAIDPDTMSPIKIHLYVGQTGAEYIADKPRTDVGTIYPSAGPNHGFAENLTLQAGTSQVCAYAINNGAGGHTYLGCKTATVVESAPDLGRAPLGNLEGVAAGTGGATVSGWALDLDTTASIKVHIYVGSVGAEYTANKPRADVGAVYRLGNDHGFSEFVAMPSGKSTVCVYAINTGAGGHSFLGCRDVVVP